MIEANDFFTLESLGTFGGATLATTILANTYRILTGRGPKIPAFIVSVVICFAIAWSSLKESMEYLIAFINGCLVFCTSFGLNSQVSTTILKENKPTKKVRGRHLNSFAKFFKPW